MEKAAEKKDWMEMMKIMQDIRQFCSLHVKRSPKGGISSAQELDLLSRLHLSQNPRILYVKKWESAGLSPAG